MAETEQVAKQLELVKELEVARLYGRKCKTNGDVQSEEEAVSDHPKYKEYVGLFGGKGRSIPDCINIIIHGVRVPLEGAFNVDCFSTEHPWV